MQKANYGDLGLTQRELQILELIVQGCSAKEAALIVKIAPRTVERHIDTIRLKLRARNRAHLVAKAIAANLVTADGHSVREPMVRDDKESRLFRLKPDDFEPARQPCLHVVGGTSVASSP